MLSLKRSLVAFACAAGFVAASPTKRQSSLIYLFAFGDSYTQTGFNPSGTQPSPSDPMGNPAIGTDTFSGGPNYVEFLTVTYNNTLVQTYNFGYGGATISDSIVPNDPSIHSFEEQVETYYEPQFSTQGGSTDPWSSDDAIFMSFFGINDIGISYEGTDMTSALVSKYFSLYDNLHSTGATKFVLVGVPPFDRAASNAGLSSDDRAHLSDVINEFNGALAAAAGQWQSANSGATVAIYDMHAYMTQVLDNPTAYGFQDAACSGDGTSACVWWDQSNLHTTSTFQNLMAQDMLSVLSQVGW